MFLRFMGFLVPHCLVLVQVESVAEALDFLAVLAAQTMTFDPIRIRGHSYLQNTYDGKLQINNSIVNQVKTLSRLKWNIG